MSEQELFGYASAIVVGLVIGLAGGGGSILTVPIFIYIFHISMKITQALINTFLSIPNSR